MRRRRSIALAAALVAAAGAGVVLAAPGDTTIASLSSVGAQASPAVPVTASAVSADGRSVAFTSTFAYTGVPTGGLPQLFVRDRVAGTTVLASAGAAGAANAAVDAEDVGNVQFAISGDGRYVVFASAATNLGPDADADEDVFRKDLATGAVALVSVSSAGVAANGAVFGDPDVSYDGSRVSFGSGAATNLVPDDANGSSDVVLRDLAAGTTTLAARSAAGDQANGTTERSSISADGRAVAFEAPAGTTNLVPGDTGAANDVVVRDLTAGTTRAASDPAQTTGSGFPDLSGDGRLVVFETGHAYDPVNDTGAGNDAYRRDLSTGAIVLVSARDGLDAGGATNGLRPAVSADGARVAFASASTNLTAADANGAILDVYARDPAGRTTRRASAAADGATQSDNPSDRAAIAGNGALVAFVNDDDTSVGKLVPGDANGSADAIAKELAPTDTTGPAIQGAVVTGQVLTVTGADPSGVGAVIANGVALRPGAGNAFSGIVPVGSDGLRIRATDGAGASGELAIVPAGTTPRRPGAEPRARATLLRARLVRGRIVVTLRLSAAATVKVATLRRTVRRLRRPTRTRVVLRGVGRGVTRALGPGLRTIRLPRRPLVAGARYVVRVRVISAAGATVRSTTLRIPRRRGG